MNAAHAVLIALVALAIIVATLVGSDRSAQRKQEVKLACIEQADNAAEAVLCKEGVRR